MRREPERGSRVREAELGERWPEIPEWADTADLDADVRRDLRGLSKEGAAFVAGHLVAAGTLADEEPELAWKHARAARSKGGRIAVVRETVGLVAYRAGEWAEAISELRAARRMGGGAGHLAVMADCERALGQPEKAIELARSVQAGELDDAGAAELRIVVAGARSDLGQIDAALVHLESSGIRTDPVHPYSARLYYAYADLLLQAGRRDEAIEWFLKANDVDVEDETDAAERLTELAEGLDVVPPAVAAAVAAATEDAEVVADLEGPVDTDEAIEDVDDSGAVEEVDSEELFGGDPESDEEEDGDVEDVDGPTAEDTDDTDEDLGEVELSADASAGDLVIDDEGDEGLSAVAGIVADDIDDDDDTEEDEDLDEIEVSVDATPAVDLLIAEEADEADEDPSDVVDLAVLGSGSDTAEAGADATAIDGGLDEQTSDAQIAVEVVDSGSGEAAPEQSAPAASGARKSAKKAAAPKTSATAKKAASATPAATPSAASAPQEQVPADAAPEAEEPPSLFGPLFSDGDNR
ncbi:tetratricopeptide repeat protein [Nakamurella alba]|uniref:tetratricopeptide repeat protein n=1 Tax=Nakamurella alba TaxID=2665158 RepID=UPI0018AAE2F9|nr:tetratricopeptide repeat protein [Nakamurella alba]